MNISQMMHKFMGDVRASDAKTLELKVGEVVKGMVLKLLGDSEAIININGIQVKAKLETPLNQGQMTMLQVQPETASGLTVMKPLGSSNILITNDSLADLLKSFGLKDQPMNRQLIQQMHQAEIPINKANVKQIQSILNNMPAHIPSEQWVQSGVLAFQRGLPLTEQSVSAIHQVIFGKPVNQVISVLQEQVKAWVNNQANVQGPHSTHVNASALGSPSPAAPANFSTGSQPNSNPSILNPNTTVSVQASATHDVMLKLLVGLQQIQSNSDSLTSVKLTHGSNQQLAGQGQVLPEVANNQTAINNQNTQNNQISQNNQTVVNQIPQNNRSVQNLTTQSSQVASNLSTGNTKVPAAVLPISIARVNLAPVQLNSEQIKTLENHTPIQLTANRNEQSWISNLLKALGIEHEQQMGRIAENQERLNLDMVRNQQSSLLDSVKSVLMQMQASDDLPATIKEPAQQLLQQITGQQLFLSADRSSNFSHMTLFLPVFNENGDQTAAINITSRKGKRGELDADNCRLLFDLQMETLGNTVVDVQVINKIVSLQVHNDHPMISELLASGREQISAAFQELGYHFSTMKSVPFPTQTNTSSESQTNQGSSDVKSSMYSPKPYKGMDIRV